MRAKTTKSRSRFLATSLAAASLLLGGSLFAQAQREPKRATDHERMIDKVVASRAYDANARALLSAKFRDALEHYAAAPQLASTWGEFVAADGTPFIALHFELPPNNTLKFGEPVAFFGTVDDADGRRLATYNESLAVQQSHDSFFVARSIIVPMKKATGTFGVARGGEIMAMTRVDFDPEAVAPAAPGVSRLIVSRDVYVLKTAQQPLDPFAFGGTKVIPKPDASFRRTDEVWLFAELRNPALAEDGTPHIATKTTLEGPTPVSGPPLSAVATPLKGVPGHYGIGNAIDVTKLAAGDYKLRVVITDLVSKQIYRRETTLHIRE